MSNAYFRHQNHQLAYIKTGTGGKTLLLFHGYGQNAAAFQEVTNVLGEHYTCYSFDLFFHGESTWGKGEGVLTTTYWNQLMAAFFEAQKIDRFSLAGFSLGARFVFATLQSFAQRTDAVYLLAPDGVKTNVWYNLATYPVMFRRLFKSMILHPNRFYSIAHTIHKLGLVDKGLVRFAESQMKTESMRARVYYSWVVFRRLRFRLKQVASTLHQHQIPATLVLGKFDKVITVKNMQRLLQNLPSCTVQQLNTGHNGIIGRWKMEG